VGLFQLPPCSWEAGSQSCSLPALERFPTRDVISLRFRLTEPRKEFVLRKQVEKCKQCREALAGRQPSGNGGQTIARKYISRRVPPPPSRLDSMLLVKISHPSKLAPLHPPTLQSCPTGLSAAGLCAWFTPDPINHHLHSCLRR